MEDQCCRRLFDLGHLFVPGTQAINNPSENSLKTYEELVLSVLDVLCLTPALVLVSVYQRKCLLLISSTHLLNLFVTLYMGPN